MMGAVAPEAAQRIGGLTSISGSPAIADIFQLANFHPKREYGSEFNVTPVRVLPADLAVEPLRYTAFDLLLLSSESMSEVSQRQFDAIVTWTRAGGRLCLIGTNPVPERLRAGWMRLLNERPDEPRIHFDADGRPRPISAETRLRVERGCGRILCIFEPADVDAPEWNADVMWLFGVLQRQSDQVRRTGTWNVPPTTAFNNAYERIRPFVPSPTSVVEIQIPLLPTEVQGVSPWRVVLLLGACLLLIGPVDYFLLGWLGLRKWTWLLVPIVALGTTWATVRMSQASLGQQSFQRSLSVADLDTDRSVVRVSRFDLEFSAIEEVRRLERAGAYRLDFQPQVIGVDGFAQNAMQLRTGIQEPAVPMGAPVRYSGNVPGSYEFFEPVRQWSPRLFRETTLGMDERIDLSPLSQIDWDAIDALDWNETDQRIRIGSLVRAAIPSSHVLLRGGIKTYELTPSPENHDSRAKQLFRIFADATSRPPVIGQKQPNGLFGIVHQRAPTCGPDLEDFAWIDPDRAHEAVLLIGIEGDHSTLFRRKLNRPHPQAR
jgi:hypothetical protein